MPNFIGNKMRDLAVLPRSVMSTESLALSGAERVETSLTITVRDDITQKL
jgi:hypothetical protein